MKKLLAAASAVALSVMMVALPTLTASAEDAAPPETAVTETVDTQPAAPTDVTPTDTEPTPPEPDVTDPPVTEPEPLAETFSLRAAPSVAGPPESDVEKKCIDGYLKPDELDNESGDYTLMDGSAVIGQLVWSDKTVEYDLEPGWTVHLCIKSGQGSNPDGSGDYTTYVTITGTGSTSILKEISHLEYWAEYDEPECEEVRGDVSVNTVDECPPPPDCEGEPDTARFAANSVAECPEKVSVMWDHEDVTCMYFAEGYEFVDGYIHLTISGPTAGVLSITYKFDNGPVVNVPIADSMYIDPADVGTYDFTVTYADGYEGGETSFSVTVKGSHDNDCVKQDICHWNEGGQGEQGSYNFINVSVNSIINPAGHASHENDIIPAFTYYQGGVEKQFTGMNWEEGDEGCGQLPDHPPVTPQVLWTPPTCDADGSFKLISPEPAEGLDPKTVTWYVNDVETLAGTYPANAGDVVTIKVVANSPDYVLDIDGTLMEEYTYDPITFTAAKDCDLNTLALTGRAASPVLALAGVLGIAGVLLVGAAGARRESEV